MALMRSALAAVVALLAFASGVRGQERFVPRITVTGEANVMVAPDSAQVRTGVTSQGKTAREASEANNKTATALMAALRAAGIDDKDIQTTRLTLQPTYENYANSGRGKINGFQASNQVTIKVREVAKLADILDRVVTAGATDIGGIDFVVSEQSKALDAVRADAYADARRKAEIYAKAAGITLGRVIGLSEENSSFEPVPMVLRQAASAPPPVSPGEKTLRLTVTVSYELPN